MRDKIREYEAVAKAAEGNSELLRNFSLMMLFCSEF